MRMMKKIAKASASRTGGRSSRASHAKNRTATQRPTQAQATETKAHVNAYLASMPPATRRALTTVRGIIRGTAPDAVEHFSYGIPGFRLDGQTFLWYAGWKAHISLYPITAAIRRAFADDLAGYGTSAGTVRFPLDEPLPATLVRRLVNARMAEVRRPRRR